MLQPCSELLPCIGVEGLFRVLVVDLPSDDIRIMAESLCQPFVDLTDEAAIEFTVPVVMIPRGARVELTGIIRNENARIFLRHPLRRWSGGRTEHYIDSVL